MRYNVPEEEKPAFNKQTQKGLVLLTQDIGDTLGRVKSLQPQTLVEAYNQPVQAPVTRNLTPLEQYVYEPQPVPEVGSLTEMPAKESMVVPQEQPQVLSNFRNQAEAQFSRDMVSITPYEQAVTDVIGAEVDSLRNDAGEIASSPLEVFSKPLDANKAKVLGFVDAEGNPTETGELFFNLKESGVFNEDGTITEKGQAYLIPRSELKKPENNRAFKVWYDDQLDETPAADGEIMGAVLGFGKNLFTGAFNLLQTKEKLTSISGLYNIAKQTAAGKETLAELKTDQIAALEQVAKNFQNVGGYADIIQGLTGRLLYEGASAATGVPMEQIKAAAEENLYLARQRQWAANENLRDLEVGTIAEAITGIDGIVNMAREARDTLGEETFNQRYTGVSAVTELTGDPANLIPAAKAFKVATSAPIASRAIIKAQQILGKTAQIEKALNEAQTIVEAGNTILKKEAVAVPLAQKLFTDISARAGANPELLARAQQASDAAKRIVSSADEVRAAMPGAMASVEQLAAKRASLATRIPEEYAKKVVQTAELGAKVRAMPANVASSILERTGNTLTKVDDAVTGYLSERGLDQAYNAALGASGVVGLAGNPVVGAIGLGAAALKTGKFLTEYGKTLRYVGKEMANARGQIPFWKRVHAHTAPGSLGKGLSHTFNIFELGGATSDILRRTGRGIVAAYPSDLFFEYLSDGGEMRPQTMMRAAAESFVLGGAFAAGGGAFMGTQQRMRELSIGDEINFRQGLVDTDQKARFEALPPVIKRSMATYSMANPTLNYNFIESGSSSYDPSSNTANININSTNPLKALVAHETLHHTIIKNNMEGGIAAMFLGDTKTNSAGGLFRSKDGRLDPEFEAFTNGYYDRLRAGGMSDAEIKTEYPLDKVAVEYFIEQHSEQYAQMAESGELGALAAKGLVRQKLSSALETILPKIPVLRDLHLKSGGAIDANGAFVTGVGILGDFGVSQNPIAKKMFREMNRRSTGMMPGQFEPLMGDKEGSGAPLFFDPTNEIDMELMHPLIQMDANDKPILKDGRPIAIAKEVDLNRTIAGLTIAEAYRKLRDNNYAPEKGEAYIDDDGTLQPGWISDNVLTQMFAKHQFNNEQKRMIRQINKMVKEGTGQRMVMINFPATTRNKAGKVVYKTQGATIRDTVPVAITIGKDGQVLYGLMSVTKLQENIKKRAQSRRGKKLYSGNIDLILRDVQAMMDFHKKGEDSINWFTEKYGVVEADQRKKFINTMFGLLNKKEQAVLNPMLLEDGIKSSDNVYRTYRADRVSKAIPMSPEEYAAMPFSYEAVSAVRMPEQRQMPEVSPEDLNTVANKQEAQGLWADGKRMFALNEMDEKLTPITSKAMLDSYSADAIGWMEPEQAPAPSQRFMPEKLDADYMKAVESGDVGEQQKVVNEAAEKAEYFFDGWHWSQSEKEFNVFDPEKGNAEGFHFGTKDAALDRRRGREGEPKRFFLKGKYTRIADRARNDALSTAEQLFDADVISRKELQAVKAATLKRENRTGSYGVTPKSLESIKEDNVHIERLEKSLGRETGTPEEELIRAAGERVYHYRNTVEGKGSDSQVVYSPNQIKSADPITRDDSGNIIPLSKRFDITSKDLRFMPEGEPKIISDGTKDALPVVQAVDKDGNPKIKDGQPVPQIIPYDFLASARLNEYDKNDPIDKTKPNYQGLAYDIPKPAQNKINQAIDSGAVDDVVKDVVKRTRAYLKNPEIAAGMGWYSRMRVKLLNALGESGRETLSQLLGATSARTPVRENFLQAMDAYEGIQAGRYEQNRKAYIDMLQLQESGMLKDAIISRDYLGKVQSKINEIEAKANSLKGSDKKSFLDEAKKLQSLINKNPDSWNPSDMAKIAIIATDMLPRRSNGKKFNANSLAVLKVIHGSWLDNRNAPKTPNFAGNLSGRTLQATIDVWAARFLRAVLYEGKNNQWRIQPKAESAVSNEDFALGQIVFERAAKKLKMNPDDLQAVLWFAEKDRWDKMGWTKKVGAEKSSFDDIFSIFFPSKGKPLNFEQASAKLALENE